MAKVSVELKGCGVQFYGRRARGVVEVRDRHLYLVEADEPFGRFVGREIKPFTFIGDHFFGPLYGVAFRVEVEDLVPLRDEYWAPWELQST